MNKLLLTTALIVAASPALAKDYVIKEVSDPAGKKPYFFSPDKLTIQPGDTVTFVNAQQDMHDVMFTGVPKGVDEMIMSPMLNDEGDKWSYTFTVPGTYKFHCHPHENLGMTGMLIVGHPSKPGETKVVDHDHMTENMENGMDHHHDEAASDLPQGAGTINSVDPDKHTINVTHEPIKALGWPRMTMEFPVDSSIGLSDFKHGDSISFTLRPSGKDEYTVINLKKRQ